MSRLPPSRVWMSSLAALCAQACGPAEPADPPAGGGHGEPLALGTVELLGLSMDVTRYGKMQPGIEGAFEVDVRGDPSASEGVSLFLWVEDRAGTQLSTPESGHDEAGHVHFHVMPRTGEPYRVVLRARKDGADERASLPLDGHGHEHPEAPHGGVLAEFAGGGKSGHLELVLDAESGRLELWLWRDPAMSRPFEVPGDTVVEVVFVDVGDRAVELRAREPGGGEEEPLAFAYPMDPNEDTSWLRGDGFQSIVRVSWTAGGQTYRSSEFVLAPR